MLWVAAVSTNAMHCAHRARPLPPRAANCGTHLCEVLETGDVARVINVTIEFKVGQLGAHLQQTAADSSRQQQSAVTHISLPTDTS